MTSGNQCQVQMKKKWKAADIWTRKQINNQLTIDDCEVLVPSIRCRKYLNWANSAAAVLNIVLTLTSAKCYQVAASRRSNFILKKYLEIENTQQISSKLLSISSKAFAFFLDFILRAYYKNVNVLLCDS